MEPKPKPTNSPKSGRRNPRKTPEISKQMLEVLKKKKECNAKAQKVVEKLLAERLDPENFIENIKYINQNHYQDVIDERAIEKLCGYPLCDSKLIDIPKKQYHISLTANKVYDITERKKFCSNSCYKACSYIKDQMLTSPLWLRGQEIIPEFQLLSMKET